MRTNTVVGAVALLVSSALARKHYVPDPIEVPHHMAIIGAPTALKDATNGTQFTCTAPYPWPFKCGLPGNLTHLESTAQTTYTDSQDDCRDTCIGESECSAFGYEQDSGLCTTLMRSLKFNGFVSQPEGNGTSAWWNRKCYACTLVTDDTNFINNGDFELGTMQYWTTGGPSVLPSAANYTTSGVTSPGDNSTYGFFANLPGDRSLLFLSQVLDTAPNTTYNITFDYSIENSAAKQAIYVLSADDDQSGAYEFFVAPSAFAAPGTWRSAAGSFQSGSNSTVGFVFAASANQTFYIDNVVVDQLVD